jgi:hypothetical protein
MSAPPASDPSRGANRRPLAIAWALVVGALAQCLLYAALWRFLATEVPVTPDTSELRGTAYKVSTADGEVHLVAVESSDPARVLVEASQRFEHVASIQRIDPKEAMQILQDQRRGHLWILGLFVFPASFLFVATRVRKHEQAFDEVLAAIAPSLSEDIPALERATGIARDELRRQVERIRQRGLADLRWDEERSRVYDARLSAYNVVLQFCPHCNDPVNLRIRADLAGAPRCPNCMTVLDTSVLAGMNQSLVERLLADSATTATSPPFPVGAFALWTVVFPPAAILVALRAAG